MTVVPSGYVLKDFELYETETWATHRLADFLKLDTHRVIWEPSAGNHKIADVFVSAGHRVITSDITIHNRPHHFISDFFGDIRLPHFDDLISNPPYGKQNILAARYARLAISRCSGWIALLLTAKFDFGSTRGDLFRYNPRFFAKITLTDRIKWFEGPSTGTEDHAWYIWAPTSHGQQTFAQIHYAGRDR
ncbi:hypothetical protein GCM10019059_39240 [Camelimonas fluminis]|uniref:Uncharacterized protein n=1 Tax=Camelimonas fluminis TaxID=1576911 RepID=A0ABV7UIL5_9HYPH|nr:hypothetical protein [Camelimonas fluminis]GHE76035.1 hypothetical protein GCM10019059_39240 [Camelimonas fluminis]